MCIVMIYQTSCNPCLVLVSKWRWRGKSRSMRKRIDFFSSNRPVRGATVAEVFTINEEFMYLSCNMGNLAIRSKTFKMPFDVIK